MSEPAASGTQRALSQNAVKVVETQSLSERAAQMYEAIARRAFELFMDEGAVHGRDAEHWLKAETEFLRPLPVTITENEEALIVHAEVPGFSAADLQIGVEPNRLTIGGRKETKEETKKGKAIQRDQRSSEILRVLTLPVPVDAARATATLTNGVIELTLPKAAQVKSQAASAG